MKTVRFGIIGCGLMAREFAGAAARWTQFKDESLAKFLDGPFEGAYQEELLDVFVKNLS